MGDWADLGKLTQHRPSRWVLACVSGNRSQDNFNGLTDKTHYLYDDFSTPCYDGRHNMIMGGSWASTGDEASRFARFMFRRHFYQHCGFRLVRSLPKSDGSVPNAQIRLIFDRIFVLGAGVPGIFI